MNKDLKMFLVSILLVVMIFVLISALGSTIDNMFTEKGVIIPLLVTIVSFVVTFKIVTSKFFQNYFRKTKDEDECLEE